VVAAVQAAHLFQQHFRRNPATQLVTPSLAKRWLATAANKADMVWSRVTAMAKEMKAGRYKAQSAILFKDGKLIDGRHRLEAVVKSGKAIRFPVQRVTAAKVKAKDNPIHITAADLRKHPEMARKLGITPESLESPKRSARSEPVAAKPKQWRVSWYSPRMQRRVSPPATFEGTRSGAIAEAKAAIGYADLRRRRVPNLPVNFIAEEVRANPASLQVASAAARAGAPEYALQIVDTARDKQNAQQILRGLLLQSDFIGGRVLAPGKGSGWRVQGFFQDAPGEVTGLGIKRVLHPRRVPAVWQTLKLRRRSKKAARTPRRNPVDMQLLARLAEEDMRRARRDGTVLIGYTKRGTVRLSFDAAAKTYQLQDSGSWRTSGKEAFIKAQLVKLYVIQDNPAEAPARVADVGKTFLGREVKRVGTGISAPGTPGHLQSNRLAEVKVKGYPAFQFSPARARLGIAGDGSLHFVNVRFSRPKELQPGQRADYGLIEHVIYGARKDHLNNGQFSYWKHPLGEEGGRKPHLQVDSDGWPYIVGGSYTIESAGIRD
jgi:hypothetical protein